jgi:xylulokinase
MPLVVGVDSSTQSTKVELRDLATGQVVGAGGAGHPTTVPPRSEQDPGDWWEALVAATAAAFRAAGRRGVPADVAAVAVAGQQHGMVVLDPHHQVLRPAKLWNDTESAGDADRLVDQLGAAAWADHCGSVPTAAFTVTKLAWLRRCEPDAFARIAGVLLPHDWLTFRLTGALVTDRGDASGTGYWSPREGAYRLDLLQLVADGVDWLAALPTVLDPWAQAGLLSGDAAGQLGLPPGTPVAAGTGDNMAGALGVGLRSGEVAVSIGTSGTVYAPSERPTGDPTGAVAGFADATGGFLPLVCTLNAALVTSAVGRILGVDHDALDALALSAAPGSEGMVLVPYLAGERTPNRPDATGTLHGIRTEVSRGALARAAFEGVVCSLLEGLDALGAAGVPLRDDRLVLVGGGSGSAAYRQVLATLAARPVVVPGSDQIVAAGAAVQAAVLATGSPPGDIADAWGLRTGAITEPGPAVAEAVAIRGRYADARG